MKILKFCMEKSRNFRQIFSSMVILLLSASSSNFSISANAFYMDVNNWIEWRNFGEWRAENVQEVVSKGLEFQGSASLPIGVLSAQVGANYTFNIVEPVATIEENGLLNRQMNYVPKNIANATFSLKYKKWHFFTDG